MAAKPINTADALEKYSFLAEPDDSLKCLICLGVAEEPWQHGECGRLFCKECLENHGKDKPCPSCRGEQPQYFKDNKSKREIRALAVNCSSADRTCEWEGTFGTLEEHVATCGFTLVPCPKECQDDEERVQHFMRKDLANHLDTKCPNRDYECEHCGEKGTHATITRDHDKICEKKILPCPNADCTDTIQRQDVQEHLDTCRFTEVNCKYKRLGCDVTMKREDISAHEDDDKLHLHMALDTIVALEEKTTVVLKKGEYFSFRVRGFAGRKGVFTSPSFYTGPNGFLMDIKVHPKGIKIGAGTHLSVYARLLEGKNDKELNWPFVGEVTITLLNQLKDENHFKKVLNITSDTNIKAKKASNNRGYTQFISHSNLARTANAQYLKDDTLYFRVSVDMPHADGKHWLAGVNN